MAIIENQIVAINYEVKHEDVVVDSNVGGKPVTFMVGKNQIIPGLEDYIRTLNADTNGEILVSNPYGEYNNDALKEVNKDQFEGIDLLEGLILYGNDENGGTVQVSVKSIEGDNVIIDYNHPLAGKNLKFLVSVGAVREANAEEMATGTPSENVKPAASGESCGTGCGCH